MPSDQRRPDDQQTPRRHVLLTGATGFIGSTVARVLATRPEIELSVLVRRPARPPAARQLIGDLTKPGSLIGSCRDIDTLLHAASYVGTDPEQATAVNDHGTTALLREATRAGVRHIIYISTAAVYGRGPHHNAEPEHLTPAPLSPASRTRLAAENTIRAAGGIILRPHLVYGAGDHWFIPQLVKLIPLLSNSPHADHVKLSTIAVDDLASALTGLITRVDTLPPGAILHANHPIPTTLRTLINTVIRNTPPWTKQRASSVKIHTNRASERHLARICADHWYASSRIWQLANHQPGASFAETFPRYAPWYRTEQGTTQVNEEPQPGVLTACNR